MPLPLYSVPPCGPGPLADDDDGTELTAAETTALPPTLGGSFTFDDDDDDEDDVMARATSEREGRSECDIDRRLIRANGDD